jgi:SOS-response transcriptional repressor LexA
MQAGSTFSPETIEVIMVEAIGAGSTPLTESHITGKRLIRTAKSQRHFDRVISAPIVGESLKDDGIAEGDFAILKLNFETSELTCGRLVIIRCPAGVVIKHFHLTGDGQVRLASANSKYPDLYFDLEDVKIEAIVLRVERVVYE